MAADLGAYLDSMKRWLQERHPGVVLMAARSVYTRDAKDLKIPQHRHASSGHNTHTPPTTAKLWELWDSDRKAVLAAMEDVRGVLLVLRSSPGEQGILVLNAGDAAIADALEAELPSLRSACVQYTKKGRHYFFARTPECDCLGVSDCAQAIEYPPGSGQKKVDIKTVCSTGTGGLISVFPSPGKRWVAEPPFERHPPPVPDEVLDFIVRHGGGNTSPTSTASASTASASTASDTEVLGLLEMLDPSRWDDRITWRNIAIALKNHAGDAFKAEWKRLSRLSHKYDEAEAEKLWASVGGSGFNGRCITLGTLYHLAKQDDPVRYAQLRARFVSAESLRWWREDDRGLADMAHHLLRDVVKKTGKHEIYYFEAASCRWRKGDEAAIRRMVSVTLEDELRAVDGYFAAAASAADLEQRDELDKSRKALAERIRYVRNHAGMYHVTGGFVQLCIDTAFERKLDSVRDTLAVENGVVELRTGQLRDRRPEDMVLTVLDVAYDPQADTSDMEAFVRAAMADDEDMTRFLQKLLGYAITGEVREEIFPVWTGTGRNGKGVLTQTLQKLLGPFFVEMNMGVICERRVQNVEAERAKLQGARIAMFNELRPGEKLMTNEVQLLTGGDGIAARALYRDPITIEPRHLCILSTNHMPELATVIPAMVLRLLCVPFPVTFTDLLPGEAPTATRRQADTGLKARLEDNMPGVLRWLVEGAVAWYAAPGLRRQAPEPVLRHSREYFREQDRFARFLEEACEVDAEAFVPKSGLREAYNDWVGCGGEKLGERAFSAAVKIKGLCEDRKYVMVMEKEKQVRRQFLCVLGVKLRA